MYKLNMRYPPGIETMKFDLKLPLIFIFLLINISQGFSQSIVLPIWDDKIPNRIETDEKEIQTDDDILWVEKVQIPTIEVYLPAKKHASGQGVLICPGGGYQGLAYDWEGTDIAKWLNAKGIAGIVLKYRLPSSASLTNRHEVPLQDVQRALRLVRLNAEKWNVNPNEIGIMGFSAGGHLASTLGTHFNESFDFETSSIDSVSARPDFMVLIYPVIPMKEEYTHQGSRNALLGSEPNQQMVEHYSNELQIKSNTPTTFIIHSTDDDAVPVENSLLFYQALKRSDIAAEMHIFPTGGHGYSLALGDDHLGSWSDLLINWLEGIEE